MPDDRSTLAEVLQDKAPRSPGQVVDALFAKGLTRERALAALQLELEKRRTTLDEIRRLQAQPSLSEDDAKRIEELEKEAGDRQWAPPSEGDKV